MPPLFLCGWNRGYAAALFVRLEQRHSRKIILKPTGKAELFGK